MNRTIVHADLDAFYASVEQLDNPELRDKPVVVGGSPNARGVVSAASYEARRFGVRSAMPMSRALRLCPEAVLVSPRFDRYAEVSRRVMAIFRSVTPLVEPLSLDEAFLDVTAQVDRCGGPEALARHLKDQVRKTTGLTLSIGVGSNKTVAKIASEAEKPDGLVVVPPGEEASFLEPLPVRAPWGIGPKTEALLTEAGIGTVGQLAEADSAWLDRILGSRGRLFQAMARGIDERPVETEYERKSVGAERTFPRDLLDGPELRTALTSIATEVARRLRNEGVKARTMAIKLRYADFRTITRQRALGTPLDEAEGIVEAASALLDKVTKPGDRFRLLGIHGSRLVGQEKAQLTLWPEQDQAGT